MKLSLEQIDKLRRIYAETTNALAKTTAKEKLEAEGLALTNTNDDINVIHLEELRAIYNNLQIETLTRRPFLYGSDEEEKITTVNGRRTTKSCLTEIAVNKSNNSSDIKIRVEYAHHSYTNGGDGYPPGYYPSHITSYYTINAKGELEKDKESLYESDLFAVIKFSA
jgi:hypothetical protein